MVDQHERIERRHRHFGRQRRNARLAHVQPIASAHHEASRRRTETANMGSKSCGCHHHAKRMYICSMRESREQHHHQPHAVNRIDGSTHHQQPWQVLDEDGAHPRGHRVRLRRTEVDVQHDNGDAYAAGTGRMMIYID